MIPPTFVEFREISITCSPDPLKISHFSLSFLCEFVNFTLALCLYNPPPFLPRFTLCERQAFVWHPL